MIAMFRRSVRRCTQTVFDMPIDDGSKSGAVEALQLAGRRSTRVFPFQHSEVPPTGIAEFVRILAVMDTVVENAGLSILGEQVPGSEWRFASFFSQ